MRRNKYDKAVPEFYVEFATHATQSTMSREEVQDSVEVEAEASTYRLTQDVQQLTHAPVEDDDGNATEHPSEVGCYDNDFDDDNCKLTKTRASTTRESIDDARSLNLLTSARRSC